MDCACFPSSKCVKRYATALGNFSAYVAIKFSNCCVFHKLGRTVFVNLPIKRTALHRRAICRSQFKAEVEMFQASQVCSRFIYLVHPPSKRNCPLPLPLHPLPSTAILGSKEGRISKREGAWRGIHGPNYCPQIIRSKEKKTTPNSHSSRRRPGCPRRCGVWTPASSSSSSCGPSGALRCLMITAPGPPPPIWRTSSVTAERTVCCPQVRGCHIQFTQIQSNALSKLSKPNPNHLVCSTRNKFQRDA